MSNALEAVVVPLRRTQLTLPIDFGSPLDDEQLMLDLPDLAPAPPLSSRDCIFCRHADDTLNTVVGKRGLVFARLDNYPASPGHIELVPFRHIQSYFEMNARESRELFELAKRMRDRLTAAYRPDGFTIGINDGAAAGQTVPHLHVHIIPRWLGDVPDPRGGIRQIFPDCDVDRWAKR